MSFLRNVGAVMTMLVVTLGCGSGAASPTPEPTFSVVGTWGCVVAGATVGDTVEMSADGTITITQPNGESGSGQWSFDGTTFAIDGVGRGGHEEFTIEGDQIVGNGLTCTRA